MDNQKISGLRPRPFKRRNKKVSGDSRTKGVDPAALAAAAFAAALSVFGPPGPYSPGSMIIGLTLLFIILGYDVYPDRERLQSLAYSAVFGLICILIIGYPFELLFTEDKSRRFGILWKELTTDCEYITVINSPNLIDQKIEIKSRECDQKISDIPPFVILISWFVLSSGMFIFDSYFRKKVRKINRALTFRGKDEPSSSLHSF